MNSRRNVLRSFIPLLIVILLLSMMMGTVSAQDQKRVIRSASSSEPPVLIDYVSASGFAWAFSRIHAHEAWGLDQEANLIPLLVDEVPSAENGGFVHTDDGKTIVTFKIADWAKWSDGEPIVADDFKIVRDIMTDGITLSHAARFVRGAPVESLEQGDTDKDVILTIAQPVADVISTAIMPLPNHVLREQYEAALAEGKGFDTLDYVRNPSVSSGPYILSEWVSGSFLRFVRNEFYHVPGWADEYVVNIYPDATVVQQVMANGEAEITSSLNDPLLAVEFVAENPNLDVTMSFSGSRLELHINHGEGAIPAMRDLRVRQAMVLGIDRQSIADDLFDGLTKVSRSYWDTTPWYNPNLEIPTFDPEAAIALLREAGWYDEDGDGTAEAHGVDGVEDGTPLKLRGFSYSDGWGGPYSATALAVQDMLGDIGMDVDMTLMLWSAIAAPRSEGGVRNLGDYDIILGGRGTGTESINQTKWWACADIPGENLESGNNYQFYCNPELDTNWDTVATSLDEQERLDAVYRIQEIMNDDVVSIFIVDLNSVLVRSKSLENVEYAPGGNTLYYNINEWQIAN